MLRLLRFTGAVSWLWTLGEDPPLPIFLSLLFFILASLPPSLLTFLALHFYPHLLSFPSTGYNPVLPACSANTLPLSHTPWTAWRCLGYSGSPTLKTFLAQVLKASSCPQSSSPSLIFRILSPPSSSRRVSTACPKAQK